MNLNFRLKHARHWKYPKFRRHRVMRVNDQWRERHDWKWGDGYMVRKVCRFIEGTGSFGDNKYQYHRKSLKEGY